MKTVDTFAWSKHILIVLSDAECTGYKTKQTITNYITFPTANSL